MVYTHPFGCRYSRSYRAGSAKNQFSIFLYTISSYSKQGGSSSIFEPMYQVELDSYFILFKRTTAKVRYINRLYLLTPKFLIVFQNSKIFNSRNTPWSDLNWPPIPSICGQNWSLKTGKQFLSHPISCNIYNATKSNLKQLLHI